MHLYRRSHICLLNYWLMPKMYLLQSKSIKSDQLLPHAVHLSTHQRVLLVDLAEGGAEGEVLDHLPHTDLQPGQLSVQVVHLWIPWHLL